MGFHRMDSSVIRFRPAFAEAATRRQVQNFLHHPSVSQQSPSPLAGEG
ncbi:MAG: hypothetical protein WCO26_03025 [Deltaproteobacteria bacterium]